MQLHKIENVDYNLTPFRGRKNFHPQNTIIQYYCIVLLKIVMKSMICQKSYLDIP